MFDIGFWELAVIAVIALLVVGPDEFPTLVRNATRGLAKIRRFVGSVKEDLEHEIDKADELKRLIAKETDIAKLHEALDEVNGTVAAPTKHRTQVTSEQSHESNEKRSAETAEKPNDVRPNIGSK